MTKRLVLTCSCPDILTCEHPWPTLMPGIPDRVLLDAALSTLRIVRDTDDPFGARMDRYTRELIDVVLAKADER